MKKKILSLIFIIAFSLTLIACKKDDKIDLTEIYENEIYYTLFVRSFADSDGDGIGDLNGVTENLDYLVDLGVTGVWLLPIFETATGWHNNHGYATTNYLDINPDYGKMEDLENLVKEAKDKDIDIILDLVINHTSDQHPWYLDALNNEDSPYYNYYVWTGSNTAYQSFAGGMVDLNLSNPKVQEEIFDIVDFYLDLGVSGFRVDAVKHFFDSPKVGNSSIFMLELYTHVRNKDADAFIVGEVFDYYYDVVAPYYLSQTSYFNFYVANEIATKVGSGVNTRLFARNLEKMYDEYRNRKYDFIDSPFLTNHDLDRLASSGNYANVLTRKQAISVLMTLPGSPFIYYGDELDMQGKRYEGAVIGGNTVYDEYRRQPFIWNNDSQTTWLPSDGSNDNTKSYVEQAEDDTSMFNHYKEMIKLRKDINALMYGNLFYSYKDNTNNLQGYIRVIEDEYLQEAVLVLHNMSANPLTLDLDLTYLYGSNELDAYSTAVLEIPIERVEEFK